MRSVLRHILTGIVLSVCIFASCGRKEAEVIPRSKLAKIYAEMLVTDQWITSTPGVRMIADTSLVYEPILEKYGYTTEDYMLSVDEYMKDPERFSRILRTTAEILEKKIKQLEKQQQDLARKAALPKIIADFKPEEFFPYMFDEPYVHYYDSLTFEPDSASWIYRLIPIERADTIYDCLRMVVLDSIPALDSVQILEAPVLKDSVETDAQKRYERKLPAPLLKRETLLKKDIQ
ncbi:MAG: DUF4296 domain-containing protein [Bacteroidales bacterium]|nr:DUF4296 domain-containing protein [Bacteroidales bacterium]